MTVRYSFGRQITCGLMTVVAHCQPVIVLLPVDLGTMLFSRHILIPWLFCTVVMFGISYVWHGLALTDLQELKIPLTLYFILALIVYLVIGLALTIGIHKAVQYELISLKGPFPLTASLLGAAVGFSLVGVVLQGTLTGSMLPIILKRMGADPAVSSAPFVATIVDVTGLIIYFSFAFLFLEGLML